MTNQSDPIQPDNPFKKLSIRNLVLLFFLILVLVVSLIVVYDQIIYTSGGGNNKNYRPDLILALIAGNLSIFIFTLLICRRLRQLGINLKLIFGKLAFEYSWSKLVFIVLISFLFSRGSVRLSMGALSFIMPTYVENYLNTDPELETLLPTAYYWLDLISSVIVFPLFYQFLFQGILLHKLNARRSINRSIIILALVTGIYFPYNIANAISTIICAIFYIQSRSLFVPITDQVLSTLLSIVWRQVIYAGTPISLAEFRGQIWWGGLLFIFSAPVLVVFISKNWPSKHQIMPYFANAAQFSDSGAPK